MAKFWVEEGTTEPLSEKMHVIVSDHMLDFVSHQFGTHGSDIFNFVAR